MSEGVGVDAGAGRVDVRAGRRAARLERLGERAAWVYTALVFVFLFLPIVIVVIYSFNAGRNVNQLTGFSTQWYGSAWSDRFLMSALRNSLTIAGTTAVLATVLGTASALAMDRLRPRVRRLFELLTYMAIIVPGIVIGIATLIFLVTAFDWLNPWLAYLGGPGAPELGLGTASVIAAHTLFTMAIVNVLVRTRMRAMDRTLIEASEDLYATPWRTFFQVTFPQLVPAIVAGGAAGLHVQLRRFHHRVLHERPGPDGADLPVRLDPARGLARGQRDRDRAPVRDDRRHGHGRARVPARAAAGGRVGRGAGDRAARGRPGAPGMSTRVVASARPGPARPLLADVVRDGLRRAIFAGEYPPGSKLPNEDLLATRFAVSRTTIREAVRGLAEEGYLVRRQGSGTFVTARPLLRNSLDTNFSYTAYLESTGVRGGRRILGLATVPADELVAEQLGIEPGDPVVELRRVRTADDKPAVYSIDRMPADIVDERRDAEALGGSIYALLAARGHPVNHGGAIVAPASADKDLATVLEVPRGTLLQHLQQIDVDAAGRHVLFSLEWHVPSVIELRVYRRGPGTAEGDGRS